MTTPHTGDLQRQAAELQQMMDSLMSTAPPAPPPAPTATPAAASTAPIPRSSSSQPALAPGITSLPGSVAAAGRGPADGGSVATLDAADPPLPPRKVSAALLPTHALQSDFRQLQMMQEQIIATELSRVSPALPPTSPHRAAADVDISLSEIHAALLQCDDRTCSAVAAMLF